jgi:hypothetical protein
MTIFYLRANPCSICSHNLMILFYRVWISLVLLVVCVWSTLSLKRSDFDFTRVFIGVRINVWWFYESWCCNIGCLGLDNLSYLFRSLFWPYLRGSLLGLFRFDSNNKSLKKSYRSSLAFRLLAAATNPIHFLFNICNDHFFYIAISASRLKASYKSGSD